MDATSLLGSMIGSNFGKGRGPGLGTVVAGAAGVAAVGGLGYLAYRHFQGQKPAGAPGQLPAPGLAGAAGPGGAGGFFSGVVGSTSGMRSGDFSVPGYEWQQQGAQAAEPPPAAQPWAKVAPAAGPAPLPTQPAAPPSAPAMSASDYQALPPQPVSPFAPAAESASPTPQQQAHALLLVRAMVAAAYADGSLDDKERTDILARLDAAGVGPGERAAFEAELSAPKPITALCAEVNSPELAEQLYVVSLLSVSADTEAEKAHLRMLPVLLKLSPEAVQAIHQKTGIPAV